MREEEDAGSMIIIFNVLTKSNSHSLLNLLFLAPVSVGRKSQTGISQVYHYPQNMSLTPQGGVLSYH